MKRLFTIMTAVLLTASVFAQSPQKMSYQAVIRNSIDQLVTNHAVGMRISILQGSSSGTIVYTETQTPTTNANGLVSIEIGGGAGFAAINWANNTYYIKTETDPSGGTTYTITGTSQLLSVPYALHAKTVAGFSETDPVFGAWNKSAGINITASQVSDFQTSVTNNAAVLANTAKRSYPTADAAKLAAITGTNTGDETTATIKAKLSITTLSGSNTGDQDGSETKVTAGTNVTVTGVGNTASPYVVNATGQTPGTVAGQMQYWNGTAWVTVAPGTTGQVLTFIGGVPTWKTTTDVLNPFTGKTWMDRNLGAAQVATSSADAASYGSLYQWGRGTDGHQTRTSGTTSTLSGTDLPGNGNFILAPGSPYNWRSPENTSLWQGINGINNPCPTGYRIPTEPELDAERASWSSQNMTGAFASLLKLPVAGSRDLGDGILYYVGSYGYYWSSTIDGTSSRLLFFSSSNALMDSDGRAAGFSVRCIKD